MKKSFFTLASFAAIAVGCQVEKMDELPLVDNSVVYSASTEAYAPETKTAMDGLDVVWSEGDEIAVFQGNIALDKFVVKEGVGETRATFELVSESDDISEIGFNAAFYPYNAELMFNPDREVDIHQFALTLPATQTYTPDSFANGAFPMVAVTESVDKSDFAFKNVFGALKLQLNGTKTVKSITVAGNNSEFLAGQTFVYVENGIPSVSRGDYPVFSSVTLDCGKGIELDATAVTDFYIALPPTEFEKGFNVTIVDTDNKYYKLNASASEKNAIERSKVLVMPAVDVDKIETPVDFTVSTSGITDVEFEVALNDQTATGFYGIFASQEAWGMYGSYFTDSGMFAQLIACGMADVGLPGTFYEGTNFEGNLSEFGFSAEYLDYGMYNDVVPGTSYNVIIIPVLEGVEEYSLEDAIFYEVSTTSLTMGGTVNLPNYEVVSDYTNVTVAFDASAEVAHVIYGFFAEEEELPTDDNCLDQNVMWLSPYFEEDGGFSLEHSNDYDVLPGASYTLCVVLADATGKAQLHFIENVATKEIPLDETLEVTVEVDEYDSIEGKVYAYVTAWPENATTLYYAINSSSSYNDYNAAIETAKILNGTSDSFQSIDLAEAKEQEIELSAAVKANSYQVQQRYVHVLVVTADGKVSNIVSSEKVTIPMTTPAE